VAIDIVNHIDVDVVDRAVVVEVPAAPVATLIADADIAESVIDATIVADMWTPVATIETVMMMPVAPVTGSPERTLVRSLHPNAGHPIVSRRRIGPIAGSPEIVIARSRGLVVVRQRRRRLIGVGYRLNAIAGVVRALIGCLIVGATRIRLRVLRGIVRCGCSGA
jgi:hypothetical protein